MKYAVFWTQTAVEQLMQISLQQPRQPQRILITVAGFGRDGHGDVKKLEGSEEWRLRAGDWRVIHPCGQPPGRLLSPNRRSLSLPV